MADQPKPTKPDETRINIHRSEEVKYWAEKFGVWNEKIVETVKRVGPMVKDVRRALRK